MGGIGLLQLRRHALGTCACFFGDLGIFCTIEIGVCISLGVLYE